MQLSRRKGFSMYLLFKGDLARLTGERDKKHGVVWSEAILLEGHKVSEKVWVDVSRHYTYRYRHEIP